MKIPTCYLFLLGAFASCQFSNDSNNKSEEGISTETIKSVKIIAQSRPFGEAGDYDMPIDKGLETLQIVNNNEVDVDSTDLVLGLINNGEPYAIPIKYLSGFEVANLYLASENYLLTWCPIVGSARWFKGNDSLDIEGFDFGRGLINNNLLIIDRKTNSVWNQLSCTAVNGDRKGEQLTPLGSIQSNWAFWFEKHPKTKLIINKDTSDAVLPQFVMEIPIYSGWSPGQEYQPAQNHDIQELGLGISQGKSAIFFSLKKLFEQNSPLTYSFNNQEIKIHFNSQGMTAWAENLEGEILPGTLVYNWAWESFYPNSERF